MPSIARELYAQNAKPPRICTSYRAPSLSTKAPSLLSPLTRELPMPTVTRISSLAQAHATLQHCWMKLSGTGPANTPSCTSPTITSLDAPGQRRQFQRWLEQWEQAFTAFLSFSMSSMKVDDVMHSRILKANHLACTVLASEAGSNPRAFDVFDGEFQAIVELANAVIRSRAASESPSRSSSSRSSSPSEMAPMNNGLDVWEPLQVVVGRCNRHSIRNNALVLLSRRSRT